MIIFWVTEHDKQVGVEVGIIFGLNYFSFAPIIAEPKFSSNNQYNALENSRSILFTENISEKRNEPFRSQFWPLLLKAGANRNLQQRQYTLLLRIHSSTFIQK